MLALVLRASPSSFVLSSSTPALVGAPSGRRNPSLPRTRPPRLGPQNLPPCSRRARWMHALRWERRGMQGCSKWRRLCEHARSALTRCAPRATKRRPRSVGTPSSPQSLVTQTSRPLPRLWQQTRPSRTSIRLPRLSSSRRYGAADCAELRCSHVWPRS